jgi:CRP-like cAMP-binding protein
MATVVSPSLALNSGNHVFGCGERIAFRGRNKLIYSPNSSAANIFRVETGWVFTGTVINENSIVDSQLNVPGDFFGEECFLPGIRSRSETAMTLTQNVVLTAWPKNEILNQSGRNPAIARKIIEIQAIKNQEQRICLRTVSAHPSYRRIAYQLLTVAGKIGIRCETIISIQDLTQEVIAILANVDEPKTSRVMSTLKKGGYLDTIRGEILILDEQGLKMIAEGHLSIKAAHPNPTPTQGSLAS